MLLPRSARRVIGMWARPVVPKKHTNPPKTVTVWRLPPLYRLIQAGHNGHVTHIRMHTQSILYVPRPHGLTVAVDGFLDAPFDAKIAIR